jgi:ribose 5-phosphate isomerase A
MEHIYEHLLTLGLSRADVVSVGTGRTVKKLLETALKDDEFRKKKFVATSLDSMHLLHSAQVLTLDLSSACPDFGFDGADYFCVQHGLVVKGLGGALLKEKMLLTKSKTRVVVAQKSKRVEKLEGLPIPFEIVAEQLLYVCSLKFPFVERIEPRVCAGGKFGLVVTEKGNNLVDIHFRDFRLDYVRKILEIPGVIESGVFYGMHLKVLAFDENTQEVEILSFN